jgi:MFS transporter, DHA1 family, tetracycline resistance protein
MSEADATTGAGTRRGAVPFVLVTILLDTLGIGLIIPVAPRLVASFLGNDLTRASFYVGVLLALYSTMQFLFAPVVGGLSDRFGRRIVILISLLGAAASYLLSGFAPSLSWLFVGRVIAGITAASFSAANAYVTDVTPPEKRAQSFGMIGAAFGFGFILGPALGGTLGDHGLRLPYFVAAALNFVNLLYGLFVLPESLPKSSRRPFSLLRSNPFGALVRLAAQPFVFSLTGTIFCAFVAQWILQSVWALDMQTRFGWSLRSVGVSLMIVGLGAALVQGLLMRAILPRLGERRTLILGLLIGTIGHVAIGLATSGWMIYALLLPFALGGMAGPATQALITREVATTEQGEVQGSINSLGGVAAIVGPMIGTTLLGRFGAETARPHIAGAAFFAAALINGIGILLALRVFSRRPQLL